MVHRFNRIAIAALILAAVLCPWSSAAAQDGPRLPSMFFDDVDPDHPLWQYPRPQLRRTNWQNLNGRWQFATATGPNEQPPIGRELTREIIVPFPVESDLSGIGERAERVWYRRTFSVPRDWAGQRIILHFGASDWETRVWVNGRLVGEHRGGYSPFSFDITRVLGARAEHEVIVGVYDPTDGGTQPRGKQVKNPRGIWYTPVTGIWQTVWIEPVPHAAIRSLDIQPDLAAGTVRIDFDAGNERVQTTAEGLVVVRFGGREVARGKTGEALAVRDVRAWSPDAPNLYDVEILLHARGNPGQVLDRVETYFGFRTISLGKDANGFTRIMLNGEPYFMLGTLDQGYWPDGLYTAPTDEALRTDLEITKRLGFNTVRKHVKIEPARWYFWCDVLGLLVWQDMPSGDAYIGPNDPDIERTPESARQFERELRTMVESLSNHPSIGIWVPFNEGWGQYDTERITSLIKEIDPTRLVISTSGWADRGTGDIHDIHVYPGPGAPQPEEERASVLGEFGGLGLPIADHTWQDEANWGYRSFETREALTDAYVELINNLRPLIVSDGLSGAIYTQTTDVEIEVNGLMTYDRKVLKMDPDRVRAANLSVQGAMPIIRTLAPTARREPVVWRYTTERPADDWMQPSFDASTWKEGEAGFGREGTPGAVNRTDWHSTDIWLRRTIVLPDEFDAGAVQLRLHHDEDVKVYLNGVLAAERTGYTTGYIFVPITDEAKAALTSGENTIAIHCRQTTGGQYIDAGLIEMHEPAR